MNRDEGFSCVRQTSLADIVPQLPSQELHRTPSLHFCEKALFGPPSYSLISSSIESRIDKGLYSGYSFLKFAGERLEIVQGKNRVVFSRKEDRNGSI